ncbi:hypothetical protein EV702DRAFT_1050876 [Suillus placidus]|uniref:Uncharacterized protein n=1 Tax=Suillus placidus TaxID=48579 RepID=A0A9P7CWM9_9AGAM|nr:hypothetical protein EV702DRAFT_1050876 [Suillus placidus]
MADIYEAAQKLRYSGAASSHASKLQMMEMDGIANWSLNSNDSCLSMCLPFCKVTSQCLNLPKGDGAAQPSTSSRRGKDKITVHWMRPQDLHHTDILVQHLTTNSMDVRILFYESKQSAASSSSNEDRPSGKNKGKFINSCLKKLFKEQLNKFNRTGTGVTLLDENGAINLHRNGMGYPRVFGGF